MKITPICRICDRKIAYRWSAIIFDQSVEYYECENCQYIQTEEPYWLNQAYKNSINLSDTGILKRNQECHDRTLITLWLLDGLEEDVVDYAGGYGILVRMLRDSGISAYWSDKYSQNLLAKGFEATKQGRFLTTAFEVFEHLSRPKDELDQILSLSNSIFISTQIAPTPMPLSMDWWYYGLEHGQHIGFFRKRTLEYLACKANVNLLSDGKSFHLLTKCKLNERKWKLAMKHRQRLLWLVELKLQSKTIKDHQLFTKQR